MNHRDIAVLMDGIAPVLRGYVEKAFEPIGARLLEIERRFDALPTPRDGKDADPVLILRLVEETVAKIPPAPAGKDADPALVAELVDKAVAALEPAKDGEPGPAGASVTIEDLAPLVQEVVSKAVSAEIERVAANLPAGKDGEPGEPGKAVTLEELQPLVDQVVAKRIEAIPAAKDGADGAPGRDGRDGLPGVSGLAGKDGVDGKDGRDGLGFEDMDVEHDGERTVTLKYSRGDVVKEFPITFPTPIDQGVWKEGQYVRGDAVSFGGQLWIARRDTNEKPEPVEGNAWRLSVKKGRDGKDFRPDEKRSLEPVRLK